MRVHQFIQRCNEQRFWLGCIAIAIASTVAFVISSLNLTSETRSSINAISTSHDSIHRVLGTTADIGELNSATQGVHPNEQTLLGMNEQIKIASQEALTAWNLRREKQSHLLVIGDEIPEATRNAISEQLPEESVLATYLEPINHSFRSTYALSILESLTTIAQKIGASIDSSNAADLPRGAHLGSELPANEDIVVWSKENLDYWKQRLTSFYGRNNNHQDLPTSAQIMATQQDLWILENMFGIVSEMNGDASANDLATIKRIDHVLIGSDATVELGELHAKNVRAKITANNPSIDETSGLVSRPQASFRRRSQPQTKQEVFDPKASRSPFHGRYVDDQFRQISASELEEVFTKRSEPSEQAVLKQIPVRLAIWMDERKIGELMELAVRSPLRFEIRQVRINRHTPNEGVEAAVATQQSGSMDSKLTREGGGNVTADGDPPASPSGGNNASTSPERRKSFDLKIEFIGYVTIVNPVNAELLAANNDQGE